MIHSLHYKFPRALLCSKHICMSQSDPFTHPESAPLKCFTSLLHMGAVVVFWHITCCHNWRALNPYLPPSPYPPPPCPIFNPLWCPHLSPHCILSSSVLRWGISSFAFGLCFTHPGCCLSRIHAFWSIPVNTALNIDYGIMHNFLFFCFAALGIMCKVSC